MCIPYSSVLELSKRQSSAPKISTLSSFNMDTICCLKHLSAQTFVHTNTKNHWDMKKSWVCLWLCPTSARNSRNLMSEVYWWTKLFSTTCLNTDFPLGNMIWPRIDYVNQMTKKAKKAQSQQLTESRIQSSQVMAHKRGFKPDHL